MNKVFVVPPAEEIGCMLTGHCAIYHLAVHFGFDGSKIPKGADVATITDALEPYDVVAKGLFGMSYSELSEKYNRLDRNNPLHELYIINDTVSDRRASFIAWLRRHFPEQEVRS